MTARGYACGEATTQVSHGLVFTLLLLPGLANPAWGYESDQVAPRSAPPGDALQAANAQANRLLVRAAIQTNQLTLCEASQADTRLALAQQIHRLMGRRVYVSAQGQGLPKGFGAYAAWLETGPVDRVSPGPQQGLYGDVRFVDSPILATFGSASTLQLGDWLVGTDKIDHFWIQGYDYFRRSREGVDPQRAVDWGTRTERGIWGLTTTGVFSFADLAANYDGLRFYSELLEPGSVLQRNDNGCVVLVRPFDWSEWVDWRYDEVLNPSVYRQRLEDDLRAGLSSTDPDFCDAYQPAPAGQAQPWVGRRAPDRSVALDLWDLCAGPTP